MKLYTRVAKGLKLKVRKFLELNPTFAEATGGKLVRWEGAFCLNRVKITKPKLIYDFFSAVVV